MAVRKSPYVCISRIGETIRIFDLAEQPASSPRPPGRPFSELTNHEAARRKAAIARIVSCAARPGIGVASKPSRL